MTKTNTYKFYYSYDHTIDGKRGAVKEFTATSDAYACGVASSEFEKDRNSGIGILVKNEGRGEVIVCAYEHKVI